MKLLKTITHPDFPTPGIEIVERFAARIVLVDEDGMVPLVYASHNFVYQIPGGWVDEWEDIIDTVHREAIEEVGCKIEILWEIWKIVDERPATVCKFGVNLVQTSYCYYGRVISKAKTSFTDTELEQWFELVWIPVEKVLEKMKQTKARIPKAEIEAKRDMYIFEEYLKLYL